MHNLKAFTVLNSLESAGSHLLIAPLLATVFGGIGGVIGKELPRRRSAEKSIPPPDSSTPEPDETHGCGVGKFALNRQFESRILASLSRTA